MKYFEFKEPYYALLQVRTREDALKEYDETVADLYDEGEKSYEIKEVSKDYALNKCKADDPEFYTSEKLEEVFNEENYSSFYKLLLVDRSLI